MSNKCSIAVHPNKGYEAAESPLGKKLEEVYGKSDALLVYDAMLSESFIEAFGDWTLPKEQDIIKSETPYRVNRFGEPKIIEGVNDLYVIAADNSRINLSKFTGVESSTKGISSESIREFAASIVSSILNPNVDWATGKWLGEGDITKINTVSSTLASNDATIQKLVKDTLSSKFNSIESTLRELTEEQQEDENLVLGIIEKLSLLDNILNNSSTLKNIADTAVFELNKFTIKFENDSNSAKEAETSIDEGNDVSLGISQSIKSSATISNKDRATDTAKVILDFIPVFDQATGNPAIDPLLGNIKYEDSDNLWRLLETSMSDIHIHINPSGKFKDIASIFREKLSVLQKRNPSFIFVQRIFENLSESQQISFVSPFLLSNLNFITSLAEGSKYNFNYKIINASSETSIETQLLEEWQENFNSSYMVNNTLNQNKVPVLKNIIEALENENALKQRVEDGTWPEFYEKVRRLSGIEMENDAFEEYIYANFPDGVDSSNLKALEITLSEFNTDLIRILRAGSTEEGFMSESRVLKNLASYEKYYRNDLSESTIKSNGVDYWVNSLPSTLNKIINGIKQGDFSYLESFTHKPYHKNSFWYEQLQDPEIVNNISVNNFNSLQKTGEVGVDNKDIEHFDQAVDDLNKTLNGFLNNEKSIYTLLSAADKSQNKQITGFDPVRTFIENGEITNPKVVNIFTNYVIDEFSRIQEEYSKIQEGISEDIAYYNPDSKINFNEEGNIILNKDGSFPVNSLKFFLAQSLNFNALDYNESKYMSALFEENGTPKKDINVDAIREYTTTILLPSILKTSFNNFYLELGIDHTVLNSKFAEQNIYSRNHEGFIQAMADYAINSTIARIETTKLFTGDPAFYKSLADLSKRVPSIYTDGLYLSPNAKRVAEGNTSISDQLGGILEYNKELEFVAAVYEDIELSSDYYNEIAKSFKGKESLIQGYKNFNKADAQGYITIDRWKFILQGAGLWKDGVHDALFDKLNNPDKFGINLTSQELKILAQPVKGVYKSIKNGVPVYLKYSQAVLAPRFINNTKLKNILDAMNNSKVDELIAISGVKVGGRKLENLVDENNKVKNTENIQLKPFILDNAFYKIQQNLPVKGIKETNIGSQIMKNILANLTGLEQSLIDYNNTSYQATEIVEAISETVKDLSDIGRKKAVSALGLNPETLEIEDKVKFYAEIKNELLSNSVDDRYLLELIEQMLPLDAFPTYSKKLNNIIASKINKSVTDITSNGGSFIQMSNLGYDELINDSQDSLIILDPKNFKGLKPPLLNSDGTKLESGQAFLPYSKVSQILGSGDEIKGERILKKLIKSGKLKDVINSEVFKTIGYRIPNQRLSSNDSLEIVGILPKGIGDTVVVYGEITAKTGSDFDIDKMFMMLPNIKYNINSQKLELDNSTKTKRLQNDLIKYYDAILTHPEIYEDLMTPLDSDWLKKDIESLIEPSTLADGEYFTGAYQIEQKILLMGGKLGVAQVADQIVDVPLTQLAQVRIKNVYTGGLGHSNNKTFDFSKIYSKGHENDPNHKITFILSAFMNAFVDIAKDDYVVRGNFNKYTNDTAFYLIRAGVDKFWVNRYIAQPIMLEDIRFKSNDTSKLKTILGKNNLDSQKYNKSAILVSNLVKNLNFLTSEYRIPNISEMATDISKEINNIENLDKVLTKDSLEKNIKIAKALRELNSKNALNFQYSPSEIKTFVTQQLIAIKTLGKFKEGSAKLKRQLKLSKVDGNGMGKSFLEGHLSKRNYEDIMSDSDYINVSNKFTKNGSIIREFTNDTSNLNMWGAMYNNSVLLSDKLGKQLFLTQSDSFKTALNDAHIKIYGTPVSNESVTSLKQARDLENAMYAFMLTKKLYHIKETNSGYDRFTLESHSEVRNLLTGYNSLATRIAKFLRANPDILPGNFLLDSLRINSKFNSIRLTTRKKNSAYNDSIKAGWTELFEYDGEHANEVNRIALDLVRYAFHTSAFSKTTDKLYEGIPNFFLNYSNFPGLLENLMSSVTNTGEVDAQIVANQYFRNSINEEGVRLLKRATSDSTHALLSEDVANALEKAENFEIVDYSSSKTSNKIEYLVKKSYQNYTDNDGRQIEIITKDPYKKVYAVIDNFGNEIGAIFRKTTILSVNYGFNGNKTASFYDANVTDITNGFSQITEGDRKLIDAINSEYLKGYSNLIKVEDTMIPESIPENMLSSEEEKGNDLENTCSGRNN